MPKKSVFLILVVLGGLFWLAGCGSSNRSSAAQDGVIVMQLNEEYELYDGDVLKPTDDETQIAVRHVFEDDQRYVTLLAGSATLILGDGVR
ncbi:hypothetical protein [Pelovirga terrestris]|uniref:Uncharacterized protein n=1 Tax=Pelovirga terrestris TaxID=2771352 RepID=A0A8J6QX05_9BACT|nr:hypothetical protein [Pelovirga terrestris]MBD1400416.1 hypothetical protein [Pelovirga terrestris]